MNCLQILPYVLWRSPVFSESGLVTVGNVDKALSYVGGSETLQELLVCGRETVVGFVSACPECVSADGREFSDDKRGVVRREVFERDVRVLSCER